MSKTKALLAGTTAISIAISLFLAWKVVQLNKQVATISNTEENLTPSSSSIFSETDRYLENGQYAKAVSQLNQLDFPADESLVDEYEFRKKLATQLKSLSAKAEKELILEKTVVDTVEKVVIQPLVMDDGSSDSLSTELNTVKSQVAQLNNQLKEVAAGAYLVFNTTKGNGLHFVGETKDGKANGTGVAILDSGSRYEGEWLENQRHGKGKFIWADGEWYEGEYKNDLKSGSGTYYWTNGDRYEGGWENDRRNGHGIIYNKKNKVIASGIWRDDKLEKKDKKGKK